MASGAESTEPVGVDPYTAQALERYRPALHYFLLRALSQRRQDIEDLTQEVFARFLRDRDRGRVIENPLAYMHGIAHHLVCDLIGQSSFERLTYDSELTSQIAENGPFGEAPFTELEEFARQMGIRKDILEALNRLPVAHRTLLLLVTVDGLSHKEAAKLTGYAVQTVKQYVSVARSEMLALLQDYWRKEESR